MTVARRARPAGGDHPPLFDHQRCVPDQAQRPLTKFRVVGDQEPDPVDDGRGQVTAAIAAASSRGTSSETCAPSRTIQRPPTITWRTSAGAAANTTAPARS